MQDFKSISLDSRKPGKSLLKKALLALLVLGAVSAASFVLIQPNEQHTAAQPEPSETPQSPPAQRVTLPLALPNQGHLEKDNQAEPMQAINIALPKAKITEAAAAPQSPEPLASPEPQAQQAETHWLTHQVASGDSLSSIFKKLGLSANLLHRIVHSSETAKSLTRINPGENLRVELDAEKNFKSLVLEHSKVKSLHITANDEGFEARKENKEVELRTTHIQGRIDNSLYLSAKEAGLPEALIMELANIFGWDIDFALEIRGGDSFTVIYQEEYLEGEKLQNGPILAAEFINQGRSYRAVRYEDETGNADYFTPDGKSMRKAFLRAPVDFRRISSKFTRERWHPVLGKKRPHRGVDYAAATGTPIKAAGDGKVIHRGKKGGYGHTVVIQHGQRYTTLYAHLSKYNGKAKLGQKVKQGQVIGYVGKSGLATGPHLHYEFRVNGVHRNPLTVKLPAAEPIAKKYRDDFLIQTQALVAQLDTLNRIIVADAR